MRVKKANKIEKEVLLNRASVVRYQLMTHCFLSAQLISDSELSALTLLAIEGESELNAFCNLCYEQGIFKTAQSVRNAMSKLHKKALIGKEGSLKKKIRIHPRINIAANDSIFLTYKFYYLDAQIPELSADQL